MPATMQALPARVRMAEVPALWAALQRELRAQAEQAGPGAPLQISLAALAEFDSSVLSLLLSAARWAGAEGRPLRLLEVPAKLQELARVYGVAELLWPELVPTA
ncbi:STAS domain-containing protein [Roseateles violae]|uniref:STAS domain-containing protein n=1 Tax=Roseateles violae TaxID=3058042 RepID=A0ABT8DX88_9BURK|nr:STAS domain-containing protein [Pelomonas sp. PFR6]MDN3921106.1 STAS domain-containing protein [Pelomonas sp. PFR6]